MGLGKMIEENPGKQKEGAVEPVIHFDFRLPETRPAILIADDDALARNFVSLLMQQDGCFVLSAADGQEALQLSRQYPGRIDLLITDVELPRLNGTDLCTYLVQERPGLKLVVMSSAEMNVASRHDIDLLYQHKPFTKEVLRGTVKRILAAPRLMDNPKRLLSELYAELKEIDKEIRSLKQPATGKKKAGPRLLTDNPDVAS